MFEEAIYRAFQVEWVVWGTIKLNLVTIVGVHQGNFYWRTLVMVGLKGNQKDTRHVWGYIRPPVSLTTSHLLLSVVSPSKPSKPPV